MPVVFSKLIIEAISFAFFETMQQNVKAVRGDTAQKAGPEKSESLRRSTVQSTLPLSRTANLID